MDGASVPLGSTVFHESAFRGRVFGVTGGAHGIGESTVRSLCQLGASVVLIDLHEKHLERVRSDLQAGNASVQYVLGDVSRKATLTRAMRGALKTWGRIDGWVNNAMLNPGGELDTLPDAVLRQSIRVNIEATWNACEMLLPTFRAQGGGSIVNISSVMFRRVLPSNGAYILGKAAIEGLTRSLAVDLAPDRIRVNAVSPGMVDSSQPRPTWRKRVPPPVSPALLARLRKQREKVIEHSWKAYQFWPTRGQPYEVAAAILFLLSDASSFITGQTLMVDGGASISAPNMGYVNTQPIAQDMAKMRRIWDQHPELIEFFRKQQKEYPKKKPRV